MTSMNVLVFATFMLASAGGQRAEEMCPLTIKVEEKPVDVPAGAKWELRPKRHRLLGVDVFEEFKGSRAVLVPAQEEGTGVLRSVWRLMSGGSYGVVCIYESTAVSIVRSLPAGVAECRAILSERSRVEGMPEVLEFTCSGVKSKGPEGPAPKAKATPEGNPLSPDREKLPKDAAK